MKSKKGILLVALLIVLAVVVAGCASTSTASKDPVAPQTSETAKDSSQPVDQSKAEQTKFVSIVDQVKQTGHYKFFGEHVALGPEGTQQAHYSDNCIECHSEVKIVNDHEAKLADFFPGGKYADKTEGITCTVCHEFGGKEMVSLRNDGWESCGVCHTAEGVKVGSEVHHPQMEMFIGEQVGQIPASPAFKYARMEDNFTCTSCHVTNSENHTFFVPGGGAGTMDWDQFKVAFKQDQCVSCHKNPDGIVEKMKEQQAEIGKKLEEIKALYDSGKEKVKDLDKEDPKAKTVAEAGTYFTFVDADKSKGVHNYPFAKSLLEKAESMLKSI